MCYDATVRTGAQHFSSWHPPLLYGRHCACCPYFYVHKSWCAALGLTFLRGRRESALAFEYACDGGAADDFLKVTFAETIIMIDESS